MRRLLLLSTLLVNVLGYGQNVTGTIYEITADGKKSPLPAVTVYWENTSVSTVSDSKGNFSIQMSKLEHANLIFTLIGYMNDTIMPMGKTVLDVELKRKTENLKGVDVTAKVGDNYMSKISVHNTQVVTGGELKKAACCNLSESFETNASVDVNYSDAITGAKQIQLLGLSGIYSQVQTENVPLLRGLGSTFGLSYIPGSWMESIQISKGASSVANGYESITGQINVEYKKPAMSEKLLINLYGNSFGRYEGNATTAHKFNDKLSTMVMLHGDFNDHTFDRNHDNFMDIPKTTTANFMNRWDYTIPGRYISRLAIKYLAEDRSGGTMNFDKNTFNADTADINHGTEPYGFGLKTWRTEVFWKNGLISKTKPDNSVALIVSAVNHEQSGFFGVNHYYGLQRSFSSNLLYNSIIGNTFHKFITGLSFNYDDFTERYQQKQFIYKYQVDGFITPENLFVVDHSIDTLYNWNRSETSAGAFFEYSHHIKEVITIVTGIRADINSRYGSFITPRFNFHWDINEKTSLRASAGLGYRSANVISENLSLLASQRKLLFTEKLNMEKAVNYGINLSRDIKLFKRNAQLSLDVYRTDFMNQVIVDMDASPTSVSFYNLHGKSYANSYQLQFTVEPVKRLSLLFAYRINDVKMTIDSTLVRKPFVNRYKGLCTASYLTKNKRWQFDYTMQFNGSSRLPDQSKMPLSLQRSSTTPAYIISNAQVTLKLKKYEFYIGGENLGDFRQTDPIIEAAYPYHTHFDTSMIWGPVTGRLLYAGLRFTLK